MGSDGNGSELISAEELAVKIGIPLQSVWRSARLKRIPAYRLGQLYRFDLEEVKAAMRQEPRIFEDRRKKE